MVQTHQPRLPLQPATQPRETRNHATLTLSSCAKMRLRSSGRMTFQVERKQGRDPEILPRYPAFVCEGGLDFEERSGLPHMPHPGPRAAVTCSLLSRSLKMKYRQCGKSVFEVR